MTVKIQEFRTADMRKLVTPDKKLQAINITAILNISKNRQMIKRN
jgi:hypothetical protein